MLFYIANNMELVWEDELQVLSLPHTHPVPYMVKIHLDFGSAPLRGYCSIQPRPYTKTHAIIIQCYGIMRGCSYINVHSHYFPNFTIKNVSTTEQFWYINMGAIYYDLSCPIHQSTLNHHLFHYILSWGAKFIFPSFKVGKTIGDGVTTNWRNSAGAAEAQVTADAAKYIVLLVKVSLPAVGTVGSPGYQPLSSVQLTSTVTLRNSSLSTY